MTTSSQAQSSSDFPSISQSTHEEFLKQTLSLARQSPLKDSNFRVGCVIASYPAGAAIASASDAQVLSAGYTLELPGNTHAEQCALAKLATSCRIDTHTESYLQQLGSVLTPQLNVVLYTSLEPCGKRLSGNLPCVERIIATRAQTRREATTTTKEEGEGKETVTGGIRKVVFGAKEPGTFVQDSKSCQTLTQAGVEWEYINTFEKEILAVAMAGHMPSSDTNTAVTTNTEPNDAQNGGVREKEQGAKAGGETSIDQVNEEERKGQQAQPRNPKKRMMEAPPGSDAARS